MIFPLWLLGIGQEVTVPPQPSFLLQEDMFLILQEDNDRIIIESGNAPADFLTQEDGFFINQQDGFKLVI